MKIVLVRVGIDGSKGGGKWNAPCNPENGRFVYVPIPEGRGNAPGTEKHYRDSILPVLDDFYKHNGEKRLFLPKRLEDERMHLDPDFEHLTYGDSNKKATFLSERLAKDDIVIFYASFRPIKKTGHNLVYALFGKLTIQEIKKAGEIEPSDIVVYGKPSDSGRFETYIPVGEYRKNAYRVKKGILDAWGGLSAKDGYIQRSTTPPFFTNPKKFLSWLDKKSPRLVRANNIP